MHCRVRQGRKPYFSSLKLNKNLNIRTNQKWSGFLPNCFFLQTQGYYKQQCQLISEDYFLKTLRRGHAKREGRGKGRGGEGGGIGNQISYSPIFCQPGSVQPLSEIVYMVHVAKDLSFGLHTLD